ncbi:terpene synthase family protein [Kitasatospora griseola]
MSPATAHRASTGPLADLLARTPAPAPHPHTGALRSELAHWLTATGVLDAAAATAFLDRGHLDLAARSWGDVPAGPGLRAATKWLVLTRILDEHLDGHDDTARRTVGALQTLTATGHVPGARTAPDGAEPPLVRAFEELRRDSATLAGSDWQARCAADFRSHLDSSLDRLEAADTAPTVPQYLTHGGRDGAGRCAAGWVELAHGLDLPDDLHRHPQLTDLLTRFQHLVRWIGDLGPAGPATGRSLLRALEVHRGLPPHLAAAKVADLCAAELTTLEFLADGIARGSHWPTRVRRHAQGLVRHVHALIHWTAGADGRRAEI